MHKQEAAHLFSILGDEDRVKELKMLYHHESLNYLQLLVVIGCDETKLKEDLKLLCENELVKDIGEDTYQINQERVDELMSFISTCCHCMHQ